MPNGLWERIAPLLPPHKPRRHRHPGRRPTDDRAALAGIVSVLKTGIAWNQLPATAAGCSGITCWRRLRDWTEAGVCQPCTSCCSSSCAPRVSSTWTSAPWTARTCARSKRGPRRAVPGRPRSSRLQAPSDLRRRRPSAGRHPDRRQPQRRHPADPAGRCCATHPRPARTPAPVPAGVARRPRLRQRQVPPPAARPRHHPAHRPPKCRPRHPAGQTALGRRTRLRLAGRLQAAAHPIRAPGRHPSRSTPAGLRPDLLPPPALILK